MISIPSSIRRSRRAFGSALLVTLVFSAAAQAQPAKTETSKKTMVAAQPAAKPAAPAADTKATSKGEPAPKTGPAPVVPSFLNKASQARKGKKSNRQSELAPAALDPGLAPPAQSANSEAASARRRAMVALNIGHYDEAIKGFEEAYALDQDPILLFRLAQAYRLAGQSAKALDACEAYLRSADKNAAERAEVERFLSEVEMIAFQIRLQRELGMAPPTRTALTPPPAPPSSLQPPALASEAPVLPKTSPAPKPEPRTDLTKAPAPPPVESSPFYNRTIFWAAVGGVVAAGTAVAVWYALSSHGAREPKTALGYQGAYQ